MGDDRQPSSGTEATAKAHWLELGSGNRLAHGLSLALLAVVAALLFGSSYERWGDPIIDLGRDLYLPGELLEGRVLYRQLIYNYGPAAPYLLAAVVAVCGDSLAVFAAVGTLIGAATLLGLYVLGARLSGAAVGLAAALLFCLLSFFANSTWGANFVLPYSFAATLATAAAVWSLTFLCGYLYGGRSTRAMALSVLFLFVALLAKQEVGVGIAAVHVLAWWAHAVPRRVVVSVLGAGALVAVGVLACFWPRSPAEHALFSENLTRFAGGDAESGAFFSLVAGVDRPGTHLLRAVGSLLQLALIGGLARLAGSLPRSWRLEGGWALLLRLVAAVAAAVLVWQWAGVRLFQATPLVALAVLIWAMVRDRRDPLLLLAAFTLFCAPRILLQFHPLWYGFYLVVPAYLFAAYGIGGRLPARLAGGRWVAAAYALLALLVAVRFESTMWQSYRDKTSLLSTGKGRIWDEGKGRVEAIQEFLDYRREQVPAGATLVVLPEGVSLNYFTSLRNPTAYYLFTPPEIGTPEIEARMIRELDSARPDYLVVTSRDLSEFGRRGIGIDYALDLGNWIRRLYDLERLFEGDGGDGRSYRLLLLRRRE